MSPKNRVLLTATATIIGTLSLVLYTTLSRDVLFDKVYLLSKSEIFEICVVIVEYFVY